MSAVNPSAQSAYRRAVEKAGVRVRVQRVSGTAPNVATFSAEVLAIVRDATDDSASAQRTGYSGSAVGGIAQDKRNIIVLAEDLIEKRFPLPLKKNDVIFVFSSSAQLTVLEVDAEKRSMAGAIELVATSVQ